MKVQRILPALPALLAVFALTLAAAPAAAAPETKRVINVNSADASQLAFLPRVGPAVAQRIVEQRKANGPFKKVEDLMLVRGIGEKTFALIRPYVSLSGESSLKEKVHLSRAEKAPGR